MKALGPLFTALLIVVAQPCISANGSADSPRLLVHLLDYLAKDYVGAVHDGRVINDLEFREQEEFVGEALALARRLPKLKENADFVAGVSRLSDLVRQKAPSDEVSALALRLKAQAISIAQVSQVPDRWPSLDRGRTLFQQNCVACGHRCLSGHLTRKFSCGPQARHAPGAIQPVRRPPGAPP